MDSDKTRYSKPETHQQALVIETQTWQKDSHSLFDYESTKKQSMSFSFPPNAKQITIYRKRLSAYCHYPSILAVTSISDLSKFDLEEYQLLTNFEIGQTENSNKLQLNFDNRAKCPKAKKVNSDRLNTDESVSTNKNKEERTYLVVKSFEDLNSEQRGYKICAGQTIKLGRVEYFVSEVREGSTVTLSEGKNTNSFENLGEKSHYKSCNKKIMKYAPIQNTEEDEKIACKICLEDVESEQNFLFKPCKCSGSCGTVHIDCLIQWIHFKVKKEVIGGTLHFNFDKFQCEVCQHELPMIIDVGGRHREMLPIEKPNGNYMVLESACEKIKSVIIIQNVPSGGIKLGRGHQCEIRITDISVSRCHAIIKNIGDSFYIFDKKSKFGTLVREDNIDLVVGRIPRAVQIGRTTLTLTYKKQKVEEKAEKAILKKRYLSHKLIGSSDRKGTS